MTCAIDEDSLVGDVHACAVVHRSLGHHNQVIAAVPRVLDTECFEFNTLDQPDPAWARHTREVLWFTLGADVRGATDGTGAAASEMQARTAGLLHQNPLMSHIQPFPIALGCRTAASFPTPPPLHLATSPFPCDKCGAKGTVLHLKAVPSPTCWLSSGLWLLLGDCPSPLLPQGLEKIRDNIDKIATFFNGDIRKPRLVHYERACGLCKDRQEAIENMTAAAQLCGLIPPGVATSKRNQTIAPHAHTRTRTRFCLQVSCCPASSRDAALFKR